MSIFVLIKIYHYKKFLFFIFNIRISDVIIVSENIFELNAESFKNEVLNNKGYSLVDFWAPWCGPCRMMVPIFEELSNEVKNVKFCKVNVDENQDISSGYRVSSIPCFILFKEGKAVASKVGGASKEDFKEWIEENAK